MPQSAGWSRARRFLQKLRILMAESSDAQHKLNQIVGLVADHMVAEVCSVYIVRPYGLIELFATKGLQADAVHRTRLRIGEGLAGHIAAEMRPLVLSDAQAHPNFVYLPETGEEIYHSYMGVPLLHHSRTVGVVVVQNVTRRQYDDDEVETLEIVAMALASLVGEAGVASTQAETQAVRVAVRMKGLKLHAGLGLGRAVLHNPRIIIRQVLAEDSESEIVRLHTALRKEKDALDDLLAVQKTTHKESVNILSVLRMFTEDRGWIERIEEGIYSGLTSAAAVDKVQRIIRMRMNEIRDPYSRERLGDMEDIGNRLLLRLAGTDPLKSSDALNAGLSEDTDIVLVARRLGPAELLEYDRRRLCAVLLEEGSPTAHSAIIAAALDIPMIGRLPNLLDIVNPGDFISVDGGEGVAFIRPSAPVRQAYRDRLQKHAERKQFGLSLRKNPAITRDGIRISLNINAASPAEVQELEILGVDGVGLYRTEIALMTRSTYPTLNEETELYRAVFDAAGDRPVIFRALDVGGDKRLPYWAMGTEENPAMGWRGLRIFVDRPAILRQQMRALVAAAAARPLYVMLPMVSEVYEFNLGQMIAKREIDRAQANGHKTPHLFELGAMLEIPALAFQIPSLVGKTHFLSIGSNDLLQFLFAADRGNPKLVDRYDVLSPAVLEFLRYLVNACDQAGVTVSLCGQMAGRPLEAMALLGLGLRRLSMNSSAVDPVKAMIRSVHLGHLEQYMNYLYAAPDRSVRLRLLDYARDHQIAL